MRSELRQAEPAGLTSPVLVNPLALPLRWEEASGWF